MLGATLATIATLLVITSYVPQIVKGYTTKSMHDISWGFFIIIFLGVGLWAVYGYVVGDYIVLIANVVLLFLQALLIFMKYHYDRK